MIYRLADKDDLPRLLSMVEQAKVSFRARGIGQWQKGDPDGPGLLAAIGRKTVHVLDEEGQAIGMITVVQGPEASYRDIDGAWLNDGPPGCSQNRRTLPGPRDGVMSGLTPIRTTFPCSVPWKKAVTAYAAA